MNSMAKIGLLLTLLVSSTVFAAGSSTWDGGGGDANWTTALNWVGDTAPTPGNDLIFTGAVQTTNNNDFTPGTSFASITFNDGGFSISGADVQISGGATAIADNSSVGGPNSISLNITFVTAAPTLTVAASSAGLTASGSINNNGFNVTATCNGPLSITGTLSGAGGLSKNGTGLLALSGANTYGGATSITGGTLQSGAVEVIPNTSAVTITAPGVLDLNGFGEILASLAGNGTFALAAAANATVGDAASTTFSGVLTGSGNFTKAGTGTLTLSGNSPAYVGVFIVNAGVINVANAGALGDPTGTQVNSAVVSIQGNITVPENFDINGTLQNGSGNNTISGNIRFFTAAPVIDLLNPGETLTVNSSITGMAATNLTFTGAGDALVNGLITETVASTDITMNSTGMVTLTGANSYTGLTTVNSGILRIQNATALGTSAGGTTVNTGATLQLAGLGFSVTGESLTLNGPGFTPGGALENFASSNIWDGNITLGFATIIGSTSGGLNLSSPGTLSLNTSSVTFVGPGNVSVGQVISGSGNVIMNGLGQVTLSGNNDYTGSTVINSGILSAMGSVLTSTNGPFGNSTSAVLLGDTVGGANATLTVDGPMFNRPINVQAGSSGIATIFANFAGADIGGSITMNKPLLVQANPGCTFSATVNNGSFPLTFSLPSTMTVSGAISGSGSVEVNAGATYLFTGANTYTGATNINNSVLRLGASGVIPDSSAVMMVGGATLDLNNFNETIAALDGGGNVTLGTATLTVFAAASSTYSGAIGGTGGLVKDGPGFFALAGANTYSGTTTVNLGILNVRNTLALGTTASGTTVNTGGTVQLEDATGITVSGEALTINGFGAAGMGALDSFMGTNAWDGNISLGSNSAIGASNAPITLSTPGTLNLNAFSIEFVGNFDIFVDQVVSGSGSLIVTMSNTGTTSLSAANTYTGDTTVNGGTLNASADVLVSANGPLGNSGNPVLLGALSGSANATMQLSASTITRPITVRSGSTGTAFLKPGLPGTNINGPITMSKALTIPSDAIPPTVSANIDNGGFPLTLSPSAAKTVTLSGVISGAGDLVKDNLGSATISGANTYAGATVINAGTLLLGFSDTIPDGSDATVVGTLDLNNFNETVHTIAGPGSILLGSGTLTVSATGASTTFGGIISGTGGLTKDGTSALMLIGNNSYTGATTINGGVLAISGIQSGSTVTVNTGAFLDGDGTTGPVTVLGGSVSAGSPPMSTSIFTISGSFSLNPASSLNLSLIGFIPGDSMDQINASGAFTANGTLNLDLQGLSSPGTAPGIVTYASASGAFSSVTFANNPMNFGASLNFTAAALDIIFASPLSAPLLNPTSDSGSPGDGITNDATPTIDGTGASPSATITIKDGAAVLGTTTADGAGIWSFTPGTALAEGPHMLSASQSQFGGFGLPLNLIVDTTPPSAVIDQAPGQTDPSQVSPVFFLVTFNEPGIIGFDNTDIQISGTAGATTAVVSPVVPGQFQIDVSGMTQAGTVIIDVLAAAATDDAGNSSTAATVSDNTIFFGAAPVIISQLTDTATVGTPFTYAILATNNPTSFSAAPFPPSFTFDPATGVLTGTPTPPDAGVFNITISATNAVGSDTQTLVLTINAANGAPTAGDDFFMTPFNAQLTIPAPGVLANDSDPELAPLTALLVNGPSNGTLGLNNDGSFVYTPNAGFAGSDGFSYQASDGSLSSNTALVSITVDVPVGNPPVAVNDTFSLLQDTQLVLGPPGILANDSDPDGNPLAAVVQTLPVNGTLSASPDGSIAYTPNAGFTGSDSFTYQAFDGALSSNVATVSLTVNATPPPPPPPSVTITSPLAANAMFGQPFAYTISADRPALFNVFGVLPLGVAFDGAATISGVPLEAGDFFVDLNADDGASFDTKQLVITVATPTSGSGIAILSPLNAVTKVGANFAYEIEASSTPATITADPLPEGLTLGGSTIFGIAKSEGTFNVTLTVTDANAATDSKTLVLEVLAKTANLPPSLFPIVADLTADTGEVLDFTVDAADPELAVLTTDWNFGDGTTASGEFVTHAFAAAGTYVVIVTVSDGTTSASQSITVVVTDPNPAAPSLGTIDVSDEIPLVNDVVTFIALDAFDPNSSALTFTWNFGDGTPSVTGNPVTHAFTVERDFNVVLSARNAQGLTADAISATVFVTAAAGENSVVENTQPTTNPFNGLSVSVMDSDDGVITLDIDVNALVREAFEVSTSFGVRGKRPVEGLQPSNRYEESGIFVSTTRARDMMTKVEAGKARKTLPVSRKEVGLPPLVTAEPADRSIGVSGLKGSFNFTRGLALTQAATGTRTIKDKVSIAGEIELPAGLDLAQPQEIQIAVGNVVETLVVTPKGKAATNKSKFKWSSKSSSKTDKVTKTSQRAKFALQVAAPQLSDEGFDTEGVVSAPKAENLKIQAAMMVGGVTYAVELPASYKATTDGSKGSLRGIK